MTPPRHYAGLDGLRAVAVSLVVVYHLFPGWMLPAGFLGVDVFFVISGFLITSLLLRSQVASGRRALSPRRLAEFWRRRARRLLPALALTVTVCASAAWLVGGDVLVRLGLQIVGAATFSYNWISIAGGSEYFAATAPELFRNLWSLAVEEQFYVLWPLVLPLFLLLPRVWARVLAATVLAGASAVWMAVSVTGGTGLTRAYFGTDTHAFGLLLGVALAFLLQRSFAAQPVWLSSIGARLGGVVLGGAAIAGIVALATQTPDDGTATFPGLLLAASILTCVAIACGIWSASWFGRAIDVAPLRWVGDRSYGIYLWHWPVVVLLVAATVGGNPDVDVPVWVGALALVVTLTAAELSYRLVETPVRRWGFRGSLGRLWGAFRGAPARRWQTAGVGLIAVALAGGTVAAVVAAPTMSSAEAAVEAGRHAVDAPRPVAQPTPAAPPPVPGDEITAIGDSVMLASAPALLERFPGIDIDAEVSRSLWAGPRLAQALAASGELRPYVVVGLGTNGSVDAGALASLAETVGTERDLVLVNAYAPRSWIDGVNRDLDRFAAAHVGVVVAEWADAIGEHTDALAGDEIHPRAAGGEIFADVVAEALVAAQRERALDRLLRTQRPLIDPVPEPPASFRAP